MQNPPWLATGNVISRNKIGTNADGTAPIPNTFQGVLIAAPNPAQPEAANKASNNTIGGMATADGNLISGNGGGGVVLMDGTGNAVLSNAIVSNVGSGIDLGGNGVTLNDGGSPPDTDSGPNNLQNFPVLTQALTSPTVTRIQGTLGSTPNTPFTLQFYSNATCTPSGYGQGELLLGTTVVTTDVNGSADFTADFGVSTPAGRVITSTATDPSGNTSEFSACRAVVIVDDVTEPNDTAATAAVLPMGTTANLLYVGTGNGDPDWYKFYVPPSAAGQDLRVNVRVTSTYLSPTPTGYYSDLDFELLDSTLRVLGIAISSSDNETLYLHNVTSGWYYISMPYCTTNYADGLGIARYAVTLETGTNFGVGYVAGRVVDGEGHGIGGVYVRAQFVPYDHAVSFPIMTTAPDGTFAIAHTPGLRDLYFTGANMFDPSQPPVNVVNEYFRDKTSAGAGDHLTLSAGQTVDVGDVVLEIGAIVTGRVTNPSGVGVYFANVWSYDVGGASYASTRTDTNGNYTLVGVPVGGALLGASAAGFAPEYYNDQPTLGSATVLPTQSGQTLSGTDIQLGPGGTIAGRVTNAAGVGIAVNVRLYSVLDSTFTRSSVNSSASTGNFTFAGVLPGSYVIHFNPAGTSYASEWYGDAASFALATPITVTAGVTTSGINAQLASIPVITWPTPASIVYGTPLGATQLNATASVPGMFVYAPDVGTVPGVGTQTLSVTFDPADTINYASANASVSITVTPPPTLSFAQEPTSLSVSTTPAAVPVRVQGRDSNSVPLSGVTVSLQLDANPAGASLSGASAVTGADGVATFSSLTVSAAGYGYRIQAAAGGFVPVWSSVFDIVYANPVEPQIKQLVSDATSLPSLPTVFDKISGSAMNAAGDWVFSSGFAVFTRPAGTTVTRLLQMGDAVPGFPGSRLDIVSFMQNASGQIRLSADFFLGAVTRRAILGYDGSQFQTIAYSGDLIPGSSSVRFERLMSLVGVDSSGSTAFSAPLVPSSTPPQTTIFWRPEGGSTTHLVGYGDPVPDGGTFDQIQGLGFNDSGEVMFKAAIVGGNGGFGLFAVSTAGAVRTIVKNGDLDPGGTSFSFTTLASVPSATMNVNRLVAFLVSTRLYVSNPGSALSVALGPSTSLQSLPWSGAALAAGGVKRFALNNADRLAAMVDLSGTGTPVRAILTFAAGNAFDVVAYRTQTIPSRPTETFYLDDNSAIYINTSGNVCFSTTRTSATGTSGLYLKAPVTDALEVVSNGQVFSGVGTLNVTSWNFRFYDNDSMYFEAPISGGSGSLDYAAFRATTGVAATTSVLFTTADPIPPGARVVMREEMFVGAAGDSVGFAARYAGAPAAVFVANVSTGVITPVVADQAVAPGGGRMRISLATPLWIGADGTAAWTASVEGVNGASLFARPLGGAVGKVAQVNDLDASGTRTLQWVSTSSATRQSPVNGSGHVVFYASYTPAGQGIFVGSPGASAVVIAKTGDTSDWGTLTASGTAGAPGFKFINDSGHVAFKWATTAGAMGIFVGTAGSLPAKVVLTGDTYSSGVTFASIGNSGPLGFNNSDQVVFSAQLSDLRSGLFVATPGGSVSAVALTGEVSPAGADAGTYSFTSTSMDIRINNDGDILFRAVLSGGSTDSGLFLKHNDTLTTVALQGQPAPGTVGVFATFPPTLNNIPGEFFALGPGGQAVVLGAVVVDQDQTLSLFRYQPATGLSKLLVRGDPMPGCSGASVGTTSQMVGAGSEGRFSFRVVPLNGPIADGLFTTAVPADTIGLTCSAASANLPAPLPVLASADGNAPFSSAAGAAPLLFTPVPPAVCSAADRFR